MPLYFVQEGGRISSTVFDDVPNFHLVLAVVGAIGFNGMSSFVVIGHGLWQLGYAFLRGTQWGMAPQPHDVPLALVLLVLTVTILVLFTEEPTKVCEPLIVRDTFTSPNSTGVVGMSLFVSIRGKICATVENPVGGIEQLCGFEDHLYDMLVAMIFRSEFGTEIEEEDIHLRRVTFRFLREIRFRVFGRSSAWASLRRFRASQSAAKSRSLG